jgi:hypothetical protein
MLKPWDTAEAAGRRLREASGTIFKRVLIMKKRFLRTLCLTAALLTAAAASIHAGGNADGFEYGRNGQGGITIKSYSGNATELVIPAEIDGKPVTTIGRKALINCVPSTREAITSITIPPSVTSIELAAFQGCKGITSITIPDSVTKIAYGAFDNCTSLASVTLSHRTEVGNNVFPPQTQRIYSD